MNNRYLYRGANPELHSLAKGELRPKATGKPFRRAVYYGEKVHYGSGATHGESDRNAVIMHQQDSSESPTSGVSTTPIFENARRYATHNGKYSVGFVYKIDTQLLTQYGVTAYEVTDHAVEPAIPNDREIIIVANDFGPLPKEIVVDVIDV